MQALGAETVVLCWAEALPDHTETILRFFRLSCGGSGIPKAVAESQLWFSRIRGSIHRFNPEKNEVSRKEFLRQALKAI